MKCKLSVGLISIPQFFLVLVSNKSALEFWTEDQLNWFYFCNSLLKLFCNVFMCRIFLNVFVVSNAILVVVFSNHTWEDKLTWVKIAPKCLSRAKHPTAKVK